MALNENNDGSRGVQRIQPSLALKPNTGGAQNAEYSERVGARLDVVQEPRGVPADAHAVNPIGADSGLDR
ncbi:hypothetical protein GCM10010977_32430 [Citricoccus zhacaiensis]|uniref:Uncharacterized protein n=1 Tax=Citricoccus zhacaiensis TaxID=489142 RepID=A0ABQ2MDN1_9MICC|nr:hypothetical protein GCM10010977_32430 [Citricoccus zhacaiensis]